MTVKSLAFIGICIAALAPAHAQVDPQTQLYREEPKGEYRYRKEGVMDGNLVRTIYYNTSEVAQYPFQPSGEWPKGTGHSYLDGVTVLIGARVESGGRVFHPLSAAYREEVDFDPVTRELWTLNPVPGYVNPAATRPAINKDPKTFPDVWPAALGLTPDWNGFWYGYFGRGVTNADFETFFVVDDSKDKEFTRPPYGYYPIAADSGRGGLGIRVEVRGFQWSHVLAEDIIFWHYDIVNISDRTYDSTCFGFYTDPGVGGTNNNGNSALFDRLLDLCYAWAPSGIGVPGNWRTGYYGYAYLESPGNAVNGLDDDEDGIVDERRDDGLDNDGDWTGFSDLNGNGTWDPTEPLGLDVGRDGVGPFDLQYSGPDQGEGDGLPTPGEPNFDQTDKDESDQIGLQAVALNILSDKGPTGVWPKNDEVMWGRMNNGFRDTVVQNTNIGIVFSSGPFPLIKDRRERFSMCLVFGDNLGDVLFNKETVQQIYNANYNFSKPPRTPFAKAVAGDRKVFLFWDAGAEESRDPFLGFENDDPTQGFKKDFEGYLVYRSEEAEFQDIKIVTDSKGDEKYWRPIAQFDLVDSIKGPDPVGINGAHFWRGDDTGLQHSFVDTTVLNGVRYYYAIVSYDRGDPELGTTGLQPSECTKIISEDFAGTITFVDVNCAVVTPAAPAAGFVPAGIQGDLAHVSQGMGTGRLSLTIFDQAALQDGSTYQVRFNATGNIPSYKTSTYDIIRTSATATDTLQKGLDATQFGPDRPSTPFDGMVVSFTNDTTVAVIDTATGWLVGQSSVILWPEPDNSNRAVNVRWPADYEIQFGEGFVDTTAFHAPPTYPRIPVNFTVMNMTQGYRAKFIIHDADASGTWTFGDTLRILDGFVSASNFKICWKVTYFRGFGSQDPVLPVAGDRFFIKIAKPFNTDDVFTYSTVASRTDDAAAGVALGSIGVVPNPYIASAEWERRTLFTTGRGDRRIDFINLPANCTVRIFTVSGSLVKTLTKGNPAGLQGVSMGSPMDGSVSWDLVTEDGMDIAYGLYIFHVDAPGIGEHTGKFAVIK
jgi:hypothetical protein